MIFTCILCFWPSLELAYARIRSNGMCQKGTERREGAGWGKNRGEVEGEGMDKEGAKRDWGKKVAGGQKLPHDWCSVVADANEAQVQIRRT